MIYLDNAATSYPKPAAVIREAVRAIKYAGGNPGRSSHALSLRAAEEIYKAREAVADLVCMENPEQVVFTYNATHALNLAIKTFVTKKCHLIVSDLEHNSVMRPLERLKKDLGVEYSCFSGYSDLSQSINSLLRPNTVGIISTLQSNVTGRIIDVEALSKIARNRKLFLILDGSQLIGHYNFNFGSIMPDVLCAPAHKGLYGIMGAGFAVFKSAQRRESFMEGGSGSESRNPEMPLLLPEAYEAGTPATPAIAALSAGINYVKSIGISAISERLETLTGCLAERLGEIKGVTLYPSSSGILSFNLRDMSSSTVANTLDKFGIYTRGGLHCAPSAHRVLGTLEQGTVRCSLSYHTRIGDIDGLYKALKEISVW